jgi:multisubunit Na+/H+ antiporter MnhF subunit
MIAYATACLLLLAGCLAVTVYRLATGPHALDRLLAFDLTGVLLAASLGIYAVIRDSWVYLEIAMGIAVLALVATIAVAHYVGGGRIF